MGQWNQSSVIPWDVHMHAQIKHQLVVKVCLFFAFHTFHNSTAIPWFTGLAVIDIFARVEFTGYNPSAEGSCWIPPKPLHNLALVSISFSWDPV